MPCESTMPIAYKHSERTQLFEEASGCFLCSLCSLFVWTYFARYENFLPGNTTVTNSFTYHLMILVNLQISVMLVLVVNSCIEDRYRYRY